MNNLKRGSQISSKFAMAIGFFKEDYFKLTHGCRQG